MNALTLNSTQIKKESAFFYCHVTIYHCKRISTIINLIIVPLLNWPQLQHSARALNLCQILAAWLKTPSGKSFALGVKTETGLTLPDFLLDFTSNFLKSLTSLSHQNEQVLVAALKLCQHIGKSYSCVLTNKFGNFVKNLNDGLADIEELYLMTPTNSMANINFESHASELKGCVFYVLKCRSKKNG